MYPKDLLNLHRTDRQMRSASMCYSILDCCAVADLFANIGIVAVGMHHESLNDNADLIIDGSWPWDSQC